MASNWFQDLQEKRKTVLGTDSYVFLGKFIDQFGQLPTTMGVSLPIQAPLIDIIERRAEGHFYARHGTPATKELERRIKLLEAGDTDYFDSVAFPSGMAAIANTVEALTRSQSGNTFICGSDLYVHVRQLFERHLPPGFKAVFVDTTNPENVERALEQGGVIAVYFEPLSNPELQYTSTSNIADIAARAGVPVVVDNTFLSPALFQPLRHGAAIVIHSATKYLNGEGDLMAGVVTGPSSFINQDYGPRHLRTVKGAVLDDSRALTLAERLTNLPLRMQDHSVNAALLAKALREHSNVRHVHYPRLIDTYNGYAGGVVSFELNGATDQELHEREARLMQFLRQEQGKPNATITYEVCLGHPKTLVVGLSRLGHPGLVRVAAGRELDLERTIGHLSNGITAAYKD